MSYKNSLAGIPNGIGKIHLPLVRQFLRASVRLTYEGWQGKIRALKTAGVAKW